MLSDWFEYTDLYLAQGLAILKVGARPCKVIDLPTTLSWDKALLRVSKALHETQGLKNRMARLRVMLSGALCQTIPIQAPQDALNWNDLRQLLPMSASSLLGVAPDQLRCVQDAGCAAMGAASSQHLVQALESWTTLAKLKLHHIQPSWSIASQCKLASSSTFSALQITERDGITLLSQNQSGWVSCHLPQVGQTPEIEAAKVRRQLTGWGVEESSVLKLDFVAESATTLQGGPTLWAGHWRQHAAAAH